MKGIDISEWVRSALVIDDKWDEVKNLLNTLNSNGVSTCYYNPNPDKAHNFDDYIDPEWLESLDEQHQEVATEAAQKVFASAVKELSYASVGELPHDSLVGHNLIFLDVDYGIDVALDFKSQVNYAVQLLKNALNKKSSPYGVVLWSKEPRNHFDGNDGEPVSPFTYIENFFYGEAFKGKPRPLFVVDIEKDFFWTGGDYSGLIERLNEKLCTDKMARYFAHWEAGVQASSVETYHFLQCMAERLAQSKELCEIESSFLNLVKHATYMHFGFPHSEDETLPSILSRYSFCYISQMLHDKLSSKFTTNDVESFFSDGVDLLVRKDECVPSVKELHSALIKNLSERGASLDDDVLERLNNAVSSVYKTEKKDVSAYDLMISELNFLEIFDLVKKDVLFLPGIIYRKEKYENIYIDITPPCDIANSKNDGRLYLEGFLHLHKKISAAKNNYYSPSKARIWKTPPVHYLKKFAVVEFCLTRIVKEIEPENEPILKLKDSSFTDLMQRFGSYNSRLGATNFRP